jgi:hypothetical protein
MFGPNEAEQVNTIIATSDFSEEHDTSTIECFFFLKELRFNLHRVIVHLLLGCTISELTVKLNR